MLQKPYAISIQGQAIPAEENYKILWKCSGDIQTDYSIQIYDNSDNSLDYSLAKTTTYDTEFILPANSLANGKVYKFYLTIYNELGQSIASDPVIFQTSARPILSVSSIPTVANQSYNFTCSYSQAQSIPMQSWIVYLYDDEQNLLNDSGIKTTSTMEYLFEYLQSGSSYYIEFQATSSKDITATSGKILFNVLYVQPTLNTVLNAEDYDNASVKLSWHVIRILGTPSGTVSFIDNEKLDARLGKMVMQDGFSIDKSFTLKVWLENPEIVTDTNIYESKYLIYLKGNNGIIFLQYRSDNRFHLFKKVGKVYSHYASDIVTGTSFYVCLKQVNDNLGIYAESV